ncbi:low molecular weight protein tyrosine phosphatase family protein [Neorhodopirellula lusitana]|uniref:low molecular weight protein tyrosine phosphatase family protein n=1 Tax=Neorhodopirellula lusitana TaxID=445327 RepID=UPI00384D5206
MNRLNVLFVCSMNQWRSPTAEKIYQDDTRVSVRSRGTSRSAVRSISAKDLAWASLVLVMENKHRNRLLADFPGQTKFLEMHVLDIPDDYQFMDTELVELIRSATEPIILSRVG